MRGSRCITSTHQIIIPGLVNYKLNMAGTKRSYQPNINQMMRKKAKVTPVVTTTPIFVKKFSSGKQSLAKLYKDVKILKTANSQKEKKHHRESYVGGTGQVAVNQAGYNSLDVSCNPPQGTTSITRIGTKLSLMSTRFNIQFYQQTNTSVGINLRVQVYRIKGLPISTVNVFPDSYFLDNPIVGGGGIIRDIQSFPDPDFAGDSSLLHTSYCYLPAENYSTQSIVKEHNFTVNYKTPIVTRFLNETSTTIVEGQLILVIMADSGNTGVSLSTLSYIPVATQQTGVNTLISTYHNFIDD